MEKTKEEITIRIEARGSRRYNNAEITSIDDGGEQVKFK